MAPGAAAEPARAPKAEPAPAKAERTEKPSIAVLPFTNMSGDQEQEYFSDGITEDIITDLSKVAGLLVIARNSSFAYKGRNVDIRTVGRELGVRSVLEGSIRRAGNRVRITAQLIDAADGGHLWAERYDRDLTDIFAVQDEVTLQIVNALKVTLSPAEKARVAETGTSNVAAHDAFLHGRELILRRPRPAPRSSSRSKTSTRPSRSIPATAPPMPGWRWPTMSTFTITSLPMETARSRSPRALPIRPSSSDPTIRSCASLPRWSPRFGAISTAWRWRSTPRWR